MRCDVVVTWTNQNFSLVLQTSDYRPKIDVIGEAFDHGRGEEQSYKMWIKLS